MSKEIYLTLGAYMVSVSATTSNVVFFDDLKNKQHDFEKKFGHRARYKSLLGVYVSLDSTRTPIDGDLNQVSGEVFHRDRLYYWFAMCKDPSKFKFSKALDFSHSLYEATIATMLSEATDPKDIEKIYEELRLRKVLNKQYSWQDLYVSPLDLACQKLNKKVIAMIVPNSTLENFNVRLFTSSILNFKSINVTHEQRVEIFNLIYKKFGSEFFKKFTSCVCISAATSQQKSLIDAVNKL